VKQRPCPALLTEKKREQTEILQKTVKVGFTRSSPALAGDCWEALCVAEDGNASVAATLGNAGAAFGFGIGPNVRWSTTHSLHWKNLYDFGQVIPRFCKTTIFCSAHELHLGLAVV
jgi:hypothetical protein